jgi:hypothetical protein
MLGFAFWTFVGVDTCPDFPYCETVSQQLPLLIILLLVLELAHASLFMRSLDAKLAYRFLDNSYKLALHPSLYRRFQDNILCFFPTPS